MKRTKAWLRIMVLHVCCSKGLLHSSSRSFKYSEMDPHDRGTVPAEGWIDHIHAGLYPEITYVIVWLSGRRYHFLDISVLHRLMRGSVVSCMAIYITSSSSLKVHLSYSAVVWCTSAGCWVVPADGHWLRWSCCTFSASDITCNS